MIKKKDYNYILTHIRITGKGPDGFIDGIIMDANNVKQLVGEFKIMLDKMQMDIKLTPKELEEHRKFVTNWEADLYD